MKSFRTYQLALELYRAIDFNKINGPLKDQLHRASLSIVLNLAEGSGKSGKERKRFFQIAMGSLRETEACFDILGDKEKQEKVDRLAAHLYNLIRNPGPGT